MTTPISIRFTPSLLARLRQRANAMTGASAAGLAQRLIDEGPALPVTESWLTGASDSS